MEKQENSQKRRVKTAQQVISDNFGKLPPQAVDIEEIVLGAVLIERDAISTVRSILSPECFYKDANQTIFSAALEIYSRNQPVDIITVINELKTNGKLDAIGGPSAVTRLTERIASAANIEYHSRIVFQKYISREIIRGFSQGVRKSFEEGDDPLNALNEAQETVDNLFRQIHRSGSKDWAKMVDETYDQVIAASKSDKHLFGISTLFRELDVITSGRSGGDLVIIAARPGLGKTTRALQEIYNLAVVQQIPVGVFSLEMPFQQLIVKMFSNQMRYNSNLIRSGKIDGRSMQLDEARELIRKAPIQLNDIAGISIMELRSIARMWKQKFDIKALYVDYLQLVKGNISGRNREQEVSEVSSGLKACAKDLDIPVIALSQLSRAVESRGGEKRPQLSDLRESGAIEQDADVIEFLYRPDYYGILHDEDGNSVEGMMECNIAKNRNGPPGRSMLKFHKEISWLHDVIQEQPKPTDQQVIDYSAARGITPNTFAAQDDDEVPF